MKKIILLFSFIICTFIFGKDEDVYNIKVSQQNSNVGDVIQYSVKKPETTINDKYFFTMGNTENYLDSFLVKVRHKELEHSKQFYNYFVLRVKKSVEEKNTIIEKVFEENSSENEEIFIFSCYEKISEKDKTPVYYNIFYREGKEVSIFRLAKKEDINNLINYLQINKILTSEEEKYITTILQFI